MMKQPKRCKFCGKLIEEIDLYVRHVNKKKEESYYHDGCYAELMTEMGEDSPFEM